MALGPLTIPQPRRLLLPPTLLPRESTLSFALEPTFMESVMLRPSPMPGVSTAIPVSTLVLTDIPMAVSTTSTASVMLRPRPMPGASTAIPVSTLALTDTPMAVSTTSTASVMLRPSLMPGASTATPLSTLALMDIPMAVSTTSMASVMLRPTLTGLEDSSQPMEATTVKLLTPTVITWVNKKTIPTISILTEFAAYTHRKFSLNPIGFIFVITYLWTLSTK